MIHYLAYPGDPRVFLSSEPSTDPGWIIKAANGRALRPLDVTPQPMAVAVHAALQEWRA